MSCLRNLYLHQGHEDILLCFLKETLVCFTFYFKVHDSTGIDFCGWCDVGGVKFLSDILFLKGKVKSNKEVSLWFFVCFIFYFFYISDFRSIFKFYFSGKLFYNSLYPARENIYIYNVMCNIYIIYNICIFNFYCSDRGEFR